MVTSANREGLIGQIIARLEAIISAVVGSTATEIRQFPNQPASDGLDLENFMLDDSRYKLTKEQLQELQVVRDMLLELLQDHEKQLAEVRQHGEQQVTDLRRHVEEQAATIRELSQQQAIDAGIHAKQTEKRQNLTSVILTLVGVLIGWLISLLSTPAQLLEAWLHR